MRNNLEQAINSLFVLALTATALCFLLLPDSSADVEQFALTLLIEGVFALWIAWYTPTARVLALAAVGAVIGLLTETSAMSTGLWNYIHGIPLAAGIAIYALTALALFGPVYIINRILSLHKAFHATGGINCFFTFVVFLALLSCLWLEYDGRYLDQVLSAGGCGQAYLLIYYGALFFLAVTVAYCLRLATFLAIVASACLASFVGQLSGGVQAGIWTFLPGGPAPSWPPFFLTCGVWPLEYLIEFGVSAMIADGLTYVFKVLAQRRAEAGQADKLPIPFYQVDNGAADTLTFLIKLSRRSYLKLTNASPENGAVLIALIGISLVYFRALEGPLSGRGWIEALALAALFGLALLVAPKLFWRRIVWLAGGALVCGYALFAALDWALPTATYSVNYPGRLFWAPIAALAFVAVYGLAHLLDVLIARAFRPRSSLEDREEPIPSVGQTAVIVTLIIAALLIALPLVEHRRRLGLFATQNPALAVTLIAVLLAFAFWYLLVRIPWQRSLTQLAASAAACVGLAYLLLSGWSDNRFFPLLVGLALSLGYLFCLAGSAHLAREPLAKGIRSTYWNKPRLKGRGVQVVFHDSPQAQGKRREIVEGVLHTFPPTISGVNVTLADDPAGDIPLSVEQALRASLDGLVGQWLSQDGRLVNSVKQAVAGRPVFIKPNIVVPCGSPYTTAAELVRELIVYCLQAGAQRVIVGEIAISNITSRMSLQATGLVDYWKAVDPGRVDVMLLDEERFERVVLRDAPDNKLKGVLFSDAFMPAALLDEQTFYIDAPKMKTHLQSAVTLAIKNSHGMVAESDRGRCHQRIAQKVVDITKAWMPDLSVIDGYEALEGIGPWPGELVPLHAVISSNDAVLADLTATQLMYEEDLAPSFARPVNYKTKYVKSTWLGFEQGLGLVDPLGAITTRNAARDPLTPEQWRKLLADFRREFALPEFRDEGLIKNIGARLGREPDFSKPIAETDPLTGHVHKWDPDTEFLTLDGRDPIIANPQPLVATSSWGAVKLVADEYRQPDLGASVMFSGVFGLLKSVLERYFPRELNILKGFVIVYGPLRRPLECEGAILFGDGAISTEYMVFAPRIYRLPGQGKPPNKYSDVFEKLSQELGGKLLGYATEAITFSRGWYW